jgi:hypothetical protein
MKPVILIARPRSGTTALRGMVARHRDMIALGEIFHDNSLNDPNYYFNYYLASVTKDPSLALPSPDNRITLFGGYIDWVTKKLEEQGPKEWVFLGVNYNSLHCVNQYWQNFYEEPYLLNIVKWRSYHVVHIIRRNIVEAAISEMRAKLSGVWHIKANEDRPSDADKKIALDPKAFLRQLRARKLEIDLVEAAFDGYYRCLTLEYEKFFDDTGTPVTSEVEKLARFLKLDTPIDCVTDYRRTRNVHLRDAIENYDEVAAALSGTEFLPMLGSG